MSADPFAPDPVTELLDRSRAIQREAAVALAASRVAFSLAQHLRADLGVQITRLRWADGCPPTV